MTRVGGDDDVLCPRSSLKSLIIDAEKNLFRLRVNLQRISKIQLAFINNKF